MRTLLAILISLNLSTLNGQEFRIDSISSYPFEIIDTINYTSSAVKLENPQILHKSGFNIKKFTTVSGLQSNSIKSVFKDKNGFLWIAHMGGLM
ncbi:MAG: hypothetical protein MRY83_04425, partial [Flavobacteriales bacterium]|nr:hypothetical protein [Flavobacteriales bacterium]